MRLGGSVIFPCPGQIWNLKISLRVGGLVILPCAGQIWNLKISLRVGGLVIFPCHGQIWNLKFSVRVGSQSSLHVQAKSEIQNKIFGDSCGVGYLSMSRPNLKFKMFGEVGDSFIFSCPGHIWSLKISGRVGGPGQIWNLKISVRVGGLAILPCSGQIWN